MIGRRTPWWLVGGGVIAVGVVVSALVVGGGQVVGGGHPSSALDESGSLTGAVDVTPTVTATAIAEGVAGSDGAGDGGRGDRLAGVVAVFFVGVFAGAMTVIVLRARRQDVFGGTDEGGVCDGDDWSEPRWRWRLERGLGEVSRQVEMLDKGNRQRWERVVSGERRIAAIASDIGHLQESYGSLSQGLMRVEMLLKEGRESADGMEAIGVRIDELAGGMRELHGQWQRGWDRLAGTEELHSALLAEVLDAERAKFRCDARRVVRELSERAGDIRREVGPIAAAAFDVLVRFPQDFGSSGFALLDAEMERISGEVARSEACAGVWSAMKECCTLADGAARLDAVVSELGEGNSALGDAVVCLDTVRREMASSGPLEFQGVAEECGRSVRSRILRAIASEYLVFVQGRSEYSVDRPIASVLRRVGCELISIRVGSTLFHSGLHEIVSSENRHDVAPGTVVNVVAMGYRVLDCDDVVKAKVVVGAE